MKNLFIKTLPLLGALLFWAGHAQAQLGPWAPLGDVLAQGGGFTLTTAYNTDDDAPFNLSGTPAAYIDDVTAAAAVAGTALDLVDQPAYEGSVLSQSFAVQAGQTLSFDWSFSTAETVFEDRAFFAVNGEVFTIALRSTAGSLPHSFSHTFASSGTVTVAIGVVDTGDFIGASTLGVSNVQLAAVPEPAAWALMLLGGAALLARRAQSRVR